MADTEEFSTTEPWAVQVSIKHGPQGTVLTNVRATTVEELAHLLGELRETATLIGDVTIELQAVGNIQNEFSGTTSVDQPSQPARGAGGAPICAHNRERRIKEGISKKTGKPYKMWECQAWNDPNMPKCDPVFVN